MLRDDTMSNIAAVNTASPLRASAQRPCSTPPRAATAADRPVSAKPDRPGRRTCVRDR
jgi:hypothetical protein